MVLTDVSQSATVLPVTVYPPDLNTVPFTVSPWHPVHDDVALATVIVGAGGTFPQVCVRTGVPPVHPEGDDVATVLDCVLSDWHAPHALYV